MEVTGLTIDPANNAPIVVLRECGGERLLPIWIGVVEASSIAFELEGVKLTRPVTHDLLRDVIGHLGGRVTGCAITALRDNTFYAELELETPKGRVAIDARPSDAIAMALRTQVPLTCVEAVLHAVADRPAGERPTASAPAPDAAPPQDERVDARGPKPIVDLGTKSLTEVLEELSPDDFGKYEM